MSVEAELAFVQLSANDEAELREFVPAKLTVEDRTTNGWGLVVRNAKDGVVEDVETAIASLLDSLSSVVEQVAKRETVLRIAVYHDTASCTVTIQDLEKILPFGPQVEISTYPTAERD